MDPVEFVERERESLERESGDTERERIAQNGVIY